MAMSLAMSVGYIFSLLVILASVTVVPELWEPRDTRHRWKKKEHE